MYVDTRWRQYAVDKVYAFRRSFELPVQGILGFKTHRPSFCSTYCELGEPLHLMRLRVREGTKKPSPLVGGATVAGMLLLIVAD
jgi:hypothetical protein